MSPPRLYVDQPLRADASVTLDKPQAHYLATVMRQKPGDAVLLFNGRDGEWRGEITLLDRKSATLQLQSQTRPQTPEPDIWLLFAPIKMGRIDFLVEKATELGASRLCPVRTHRTIVTRLNEERLRAHSIEAAEQSERLTVPPLADYMSLEKTLAEWPTDRLLIYADETGTGLSPAALLSASFRHCEEPQATKQSPEHSTGDCHVGAEAPPRNDAPPLALLTGPEGGFAPEELALLHRLPFTKPMSLGPRVLRADTAALAALTCLMAFCGDWRNGRPRSTDYSG